MKKKTAKEATAKAKILGSEESKVARARLSWRWTPAAGLPGILAEALAKEGGQADSSEWAKENAGALVWRWGLALPEQAGRFAIELSESSQSELAGVQWLTGLAYLASCGGLLGKLPFYVQVDRDEDYDFNDGVTVNFATEPGWVFPSEKVGRCARFMFDDFVDSANWSVGGTKGGVGFDVPGFTAMVSQVAAWKFYGARQPQVDWPAVASLLGRAGERDLVAEAAGPAMPLAGAGSARVVGRL